MRLLIAEDSAVCHALITKYLHEWGFEAVVANDGAEARQILQVANTPVAASATTRAMPLSIGAAIAGPRSGFKIEVLLAKSDAGLYEAKRKGRNRIEHMAFAENSANQAREVKSRI